MYNVHCNEINSRYVNIITPRNGIIEDMSSHNGIRYMKRSIINGKDFCIRLSKMYIFRLCTYIFNL